MKAVKGNVQLTLSNDAEAKAYQGEGFDIYDDDGVLIMHAAGKKIAWEEHQHIVSALEEALLAAQAADPPLDEKSAAAENKRLKKELEAAQKAITDLEAEKATLETAAADLEAKVDALQ